MLNSSRYCSSVAYEFKHDDQNERQNTRTIATYFPQSNLPISSDFRTSTPRPLCLGLKTLKSNEQEEKGI